MNTFLRWAGSKRKLLPILLGSVPSDFGRYIEPFVGSGCLFFALNPPRALLADINADLINAYQVLKHDVGNLVQLLAAFNGSEEEYYRVRSAAVSETCRFKRAAMFIYLNRFCFNGLYRTNRQGRFNVPYGGGKTGALPSEAQLRSCSQSLQSVTLRSTSFQHTLDEVSSKDFVYMDPPYSVRSRRVFNEYSHFSFGAEELKCLRANLLCLDRKGVRFLVSYAVSREATDLSKGFRHTEIVVQRQIAGFANKRRKNRELLITNY